MIAPRSLHGADSAHAVAGSALVDEERESDELGDPGSCARRRALVELRGDDGGCYLDRVRGRSGFWRITGAKIAGPIRWAGEPELGCDPA